GRLRGGDPGRQVDGPHLRPVALRPVRAHHRRHQDGVRGAHPAEPQARQQRDLPEPLPGEGFLRGKACGRSGGMALDDVSRLRISPYVSSLTDDVFVLTGLPEEVIAVLFAYYSRSRDD